MTKEHKATLMKMLEQFRTNHNDDRADALYEALREIETLAVMREMPEPQKGEGTDVI